MTAKKKTMNRRWHILPFLLVVLILCTAGSLIALHIHNDHKESTKTGYSSSSVNYSPSSTTDNAANNSRKASPAPSQTLNDQSAAPSGTAPAVTIVSANVNSGNLHVGTAVSGATSGSCVLSASQNSQQITLSTTTVRQDVNDYDCGVFNIATSKFPGSGDWKLTLTVTANGQQGSASTNVNISTGS